ncbi:MAG: amino acid adenylation domain-containing protein, partial [Cyanobacteria bacterium J06600_6]
MDNVSDIYELSPMQQGMLFHTIYEPNSGVYFEQRSCLLTGKLNTINFKQAWSQIIDRYPILRTAFYWEDLEKPFQVVFNDAELPWIEEDWSSLTESEQDNKLIAWLESDRTSGFALNQAPLMRCALFKLDRDKYRFVWSHHHILMDGWCNGILLQEVLAIYKSLERGENIYLEPTQPYRNYIAWLQEQEISKARAYWQISLAGFTEPTSLATSIKNISNSETKDIWVSLPLEITEELADFSTKHRLTLNTIIQGAWALLLSRYCDRPDILFGATVSGRPADLKGVESIVGLFINTLPVRVKLAPEQKLVDWLQKIQQQQINREEYSYSSLVDIQKWSDVSSEQALFDSLVIFENYPISLSEFLQNSDAEFIISDLEGFEKTNYPLTLYIIPGERLTLKVSYNTNHFTLEEIEQVSDRLILILTNFIKSPDIKLANISITSKSELNKLANNDNRINYPQDLLLPQLFESIVNSEREKTALITDRESLTYSELNKRANKLARHLRSQGVCKGESRVGIYLARDSDLIISLLAVLKTGAAYVPLDPSYPRSRIDYIINDANIPFLITKNGSFITSGNNLLIINLDREQDKIQSQSPRNLNIKISPQDLAYVIYTSGSTGKPKGVAVQHSSLFNFLYSMKEQPGITKSDRLLAITTISFDIASLEIYLPLTTGATVVLANRETIIDADLLSQKIEDNDITIMQATPATWQILVANNWQGNKQLKILCGGEALSQKLALELYTKSQEIWNLYGPTETTIWSSVYQFKSDRNCELNNVSIGKAIANTQFYILDSQLNLVPPGIPGELYIGGAGLARGYLNRPDLTAEKFIPNPFVALKDTASHRTYHGMSLLYKTGDRVRQLPALKDTALHNGNLEYLGRLDNQVKIRGYRIELGEIEAVLNQYPNLQTSVVIAHEQSLTAYFNGKANKQELRQFLTNKLPSYMIPSNIIQLESFPLTPNGKIDLQALSNLDINRKDERLIPSIISTTPTEEIILGIWAEILERDNINTYENFFELGGHSLLATRVTSQIRQVFSIDLPLRNLFEHPTIKDLAQIVDRAQENSAEKAVYISIISREEELPLSFAQQRQWFLHQLEPDNPWYNISTAVKITGNLDIVRLQKCLDILVERQEILRTSFLTVEGKPKLIISDAAKVELSVFDLGALSTKEQQKRIKQLQIDDAQQPFALDRCPLMRVKLLTIDASEQILLLSLHHIIGDGWSMGVLVDEIAGLYVDPPALSRTLLAKGGWGGSIQYLDYAVWQRKYLQGKVLDRQVEYWQEKLADAPPISSISTDYPRKPQSSFDSAAYSFQINDRLTQNLKQISRSNSGTLFITLYSALALLLHRYTDNDDLVIGTPIANRDRAEIEGLIGLFANTLALRINLADNPSFTELLARARETALGAYSHQDLPFEQLIDKLQLERSLSYTPLFQVMLVLESQNQKALEVEGLSWKPLERVTTQAKFELTFLIKETDKGLQGSIKYNKALFSADTIHRLAGHFRTLLISIADNPEAKISNISILSKSELKQLTSKFNQSNNVAINDCIHELFELQAKLTPDAVAIVHESSEITYQELNSRANTWAHYLQSLGVKSETKVGLMCDRNINTIIALLAILKAGGCYVPLDPNYPQQRLNWMLEDTQLNILITQTKYIEKLNATNLILVNLDSPAAPAAPSTPAAPPTPNSLAYIIYTSGSTGTPKGVAISHRGIVRLVKDPNYVELNTDTVSLQAAPISFDASTFEIWGALLNGGRIVILSNPVPSLSELAETIVKQKINTLWLTAGLFHLM